MLVDRVVSAFAFDYAMLYYACEGLGQIREQNMIQGFLTNMSNISN